MELKILSIGHVYTYVQSPLCAKLMSSKKEQVDANALISLKQLHFYLPKNCIKFRKNSVMVDGVLPVNIVTFIFTAVAVPLFWVDVLVSSQTH